MVTNSGPTDVHDVVMNDNVPGELQVLNVTTSKGTATITGQQVTVTIGTLAPGYEADVVLLDAPDWRYLAYHLGGPVVSRTIVAGEPGELP